MPDLHVVAVLTARPGAEAEVRAAIAAGVAPSRAEEGCLSYDLFVSEADPAAFLTVERWRSHADLEAHMKTPHLAELTKALDGLLAGPPAIHPLGPIDVA